MSLGTIILIILVIALVGGLVPWGTWGAQPQSRYPGYGYGNPVGGGLGLIIVIILILVLFGRL